MEYTDKELEIMLNNAQDCELEEVISYASNVLALETQRFMDNIANDEVERNHWFKRIREQGVSIEKEYFATNFKHNDVQVSSADHVKDLFSLKDWHLIFSDLCLVDVLATLNLFS